MKTVKANLPVGVKKMFKTKIGKKIRLVNKLYLKPKKAKATSK